MKITFKKRPIHRAPIAVLQHLYYYTAQYGLSVKQFTGAHWTYWEKLPEQLRNAQNNPEELKSIIEELNKLASGSEQRLKARRSQIKETEAFKEGKWAEKEIILNAQLLSVLAALPSDFLALGFKNLARTDYLPNSLEIFDLHIDGRKGEDTDFVEPDLLLLGDRHLLMVEVKTRGGADSSRSYPPHQLLNYLRLVLECRNSFDESLPKCFTHFILVPSIDPKWLENHSEWVLQSCDGEGKLKVNPSALINSAKKKPGYNYQELKLLAAQVPIYYRSWAQLYEAFRMAAEQFGDKRNFTHWYKIVQEIGEISQIAGKYA
jgi:hypothetical protein